MRHLSPFSNYSRIADFCLALDTLLYISGAEARYPRSLANRDRYRDTKMVLDNPLRLYMVPVNRGALFGGFPADDLVERIAYFG